MNQMENSLGKLRCNTAEDSKNCQLDSLMTGNDVWKNGTDKIRIDCCLDRIRQIQHMRSVQGHSGGQQIDPRLQNTVLIPYGWSDYIYHVGSSFDYRSICEGGLIAGGNGGREGRQTGFFTVVDPMPIAMLPPRYEPNEPRTIPHKLKWRRMHSAVHRFDLRLAQNKGMEFGVTINNAITLYC